MDKQWIQEGEQHVLIFSPYYEELRIAEIYRLVGYEDWYYTSELLKIDGEILESVDIDDAKQEIEDMVTSHYESERNYYQELLCKFEGE
jgi:hypothetical protein